MQDTNSDSVPLNTHPVVGGAIAHENTHPPLTHQDHQPTSSPFALDGTATAALNPGFLQQDNARLRSSTDQLRIEVEVVRRQNSELQTRINETREGLRPLEHSLQDLLYLVPGLQNGGEEVSNRLFAILEGVTAVHKTLSSGASGG